MINLNLSLRHVWASTKLARVMRKHQRTNAEDGLCNEARDILCTTAKFIEPKNCIFKDTSIFNEGERVDVI